MPQPGGNAHFVQYFLVARTTVEYRELQRDVDFLDRIVSTVDVRERSGRNAAENSVLAKFLPCPECQATYPDVRTRLTASCQPPSRR